MGTASFRRGKEHDPDRRLGLSHPAAFISTYGNISVVVLQASA
jgi:hypothetical protein